MLTDILSPIKARSADKMPPCFDNAEKIALKGDSESLHYGQLIGVARQLAEQLRQSDIHCLALFADNSPAWVLVDLACQMARIPLLPLPLFFSHAQLQHAVDSCSADALLTDQPAAITQLFFSGGIPDAQMLATRFSLIRRLKQTTPLPEGTGKITFTSGSTGQPKGVCLADSTQIQVAQSLVDAIDISGVRHLCLLPLSTLLENVAGIYAPLLSGGEVTVPSLATLGFSGSTLADPSKLLAAIAHYQPQSIILLPQLLMVLINAMQQQWQPPKSLQFIAVGGARVSPRLLQQAQDRGLPVYEGYGLSECASVVSLNTRAKNRPGTVGKVLAERRVDIVKDEIAVSGNIFLGYVNQPESWYPQQVLTGDLGWQDTDGFIELRGRRKNILISSFGRNINPEWVESELLAHPELAQAVVVGDGRPFCCALIFPRIKKMNDAAIQRLIDATNRDLPDYAQILRWHRLREPMKAADGLLTDNGRPKRQPIHQHFANIIDTMYNAVTEVYQP